MTGHCGCLALALPKISDLFALVAVPIYQADCFPKETRVGRCTQAILQVYEHMLLSSLRPLRFVLLTFYPFFICINSYIIGPSAVAHLFTYVPGPQRPYLLYC